MITGIHHRAPGGERSRALVVMLAGVGIEASEFSERGFVGVLHERTPQSTSSPRGQTSTSILMAISPRPYTVTSLTLR